MSEPEVRLKQRVPGADFDRESSLSCGGTHDFGGDDLPYQFCFPEALQSGRGEDDGIVFALLEFS